MKTTDIQIRDPFVLPIEDDKTYYLFGTTDKNCWGEGTGFDCYKSNDLENWEGPIQAFRPPENFWAKKNFWAPEVHAFKGRYYMFASFKAEKQYRGTQILVSDSVSGPFKPLVDRPVTPQNWECLDGTLYVDRSGHPWIVFCHEWTQVHNGAIYAMQLSDDLTKSAGRPVFLFNASEGPWVKQSEWPENDPRSTFPPYVTDGPCLHRLQNGKLVMLWSSTGDKGYAMGIAQSQSGDITGPWIQQESPLWSDDGGHGMLFRTHDARLLLTFHQPNNTPKERPVFIEIEETEDSLQLKS